MRHALIERNGTSYRDKQESLDYIDSLEITESRIHGLEIVKLTKWAAETNMYKTAWYHTQENVYESARIFIREQMIGQWNYAEFK